MGKYEQYPTPGIPSEELRKTIAANAERAAKNPELLKKAAALREKKGAAMEGDIKATGPGEGISGMEDLGREIEEDLDKEDGRAA